MPEGVRQIRKETAILTEGVPCSPCQHSAQCAKANLACEEFVHYLGTPGSVAWKGATTPDSQRFPTRAIYDKVNAHHPTRAQTEWRKAGKAKRPGRPSRS